LGSEMRTGKRFPLALPIHLKDHKAGKVEKATTENVSGAGVYVLASTKLVAGASIEFDITFPAEVLGTETHVAIHCKGHVVRVDQPKDKSKHKQQGVACVIDHYKFSRKK
jgi:hypothetical protein